MTSFVRCGASGELLQLLAALAYIAQELLQLFCTCAVCAIAAVTFHDRRDYRAAVACRAQQDGIAVAQDGANTIGPIIGTNFGSITYDVSLAPAVS